MHEGGHDDGGGGVDLKEEEEVWFDMGGWQGAREGRERTGARAVLDTKK